MKQEYLQVSSNSKAHTETNFAALTPKRYQDALHIRLCGSTQVHCVLAHNSFPL
jgi:hypothetical protein